MIFLVRQAVLVWQIFLEVIQSSAKRPVWEDTYLPMSLIEMINSSGPSIEPCSTREVTQPIQKCHQLRPIFYGLKESLG